MNDFIVKQLVGGMPDLARRLEWWVDNFRFRISQAIERLRTGKDTLAKFHQFGRDELRDSYYGIAETGKGAPLTPKEMAEIRRALKEQLGYWDRFCQDIADQRKALQGRKLKGDELEEAYNAMYAKFDRRAQSYAGAMEAEGQKWAMAANESGWYQWTLHPAEHCPDCLERDGLVAQVKNGRLPFYPKNGSTACFFKADKVRVLTRERGYVRLASVREGEYVVTHRGRWQKVIGITKIKVKDMLAVSLVVLFGEKPVDITVTPDHQFLRGDNWVRADSLREGDNIGRLGRKCAREGCNKLVHLGRDDSLEHCSRRCAIIAGQNWRHANAKIREMVTEGRDPLTRWRTDVTHEELCVIQQKAGATRAEMYPREGRTYEELYGPQVAKRTKEKLSIARAGKTWEEIFGEERAQELRQMYGELMANGRAKAMRALVKNPNNGPWEERVGPERATEIKARLSEATQKQWDENYEEMHQRVLKGIISYQESREPNAERTRPEREMAQILDKMGLEYKEQVWLLGRYCVDFFLPGLGVVIEADGNYWHDYPRGRDKDRQRDAEIKTEKGFDVLRFWGSEIRNSPESVKAQLTRTLRNHNGQYVLSNDAVITSVKREKRNGTVWCLVVEEDSSFAVTQGLISHNCLYNCQCTWEPISRFKAMALRALGKLKQIVGRKSLVEVADEWLEKGGPGSGWFAPPRGTHGLGSMGGKVTEKTAKQMRAELKRDFKRRKARQEQLRARGDDLARQHGDLMAKNAELHEERKKAWVEGRIKDWEKADTGIAKVNQEARVLWSKLGKNEKEYWNVIHHMREGALEKLKVANPADFETDTRKLRKGKEELQEGADAFASLVGRGTLDGQKVKIHTTREVRGYYSMDGVYLPPLNRRKAVMVHELGHWLEDRDPDAHAKALAFLEKRTVGEQSVSLRSITGNPSHRTYEVTKKNKFLHPYMGKQYPRGYATEIISMGAEYMHTEPIEFAEKDPEYFDFMYDLMRGQ